MSALTKIWQRLFLADGKHGYTCDSCGEELFDYPSTRICAACNERIEQNDKKFAKNAVEKRFRKGYV